MSREMHTNTAPLPKMRFRRLAQIIASLVLLAASSSPYPSATQYAPEAPRVAVSDLDLNQPRDDDNQGQHKYKFSDFELQTAFGGVNTSSYRYDNGSIEDASALSIISYDPKTKTPQWAKSVGAFQHSTPSREYHTYRLEDPENQMWSRTSGTLISSPDGHYISLLFRVSAFQEGKGVNDSSTIFDRSTHVIVLDAKTGGTVRQEKLPDLVLGQALTNDSLAVETAQDFFPGGSGRGKLSVFSLKSDSDPATTIPVDQWLVGASGRTFLLVPEAAIGGRPGYYPSTVTVTQLDAKGHVKGSISDVTTILGGGWLRKLSTPASQLDGVDDDHRPSELLHLDTGATMDVTGKYVWLSNVPTGLGVLVGESVPTEDSKTQPAPIFWLSSTDDGHPHTENLEQFIDDW